MRPEEIIEKRFVAECKKMGIKSRKFEIAGEKGAPDQIVLLPGGMVMFFEFKRPNGGTISIHQKKFILELESMNFVVEVVDSWEYPIQKIKAYLEAYYAYE